MTDIPDEAVEAAAQALFVDQEGDFIQPANPWLTTFEQSRRPKFTRRAQRALEAAAPVLLAAERERAAAEALNSAADDYEEFGLFGEMPIAAWLRLRATRQGRGES